MFLRNNVAAVITDAIALFAPLKRLLTAPVNTEPVKKLLTA